MIHKVNHIQPFFSSGDGLVWNSIDGAWYSFHARSLIRAVVLLFQYRYFIILPVHLCLAESGSWIEISCDLCAACRSRGISRPFLPLCVCLFSSSCSRHNHAIGLQRRGGGVVHGLCGVRRYKKRGSVCSCSHLQVEVADCADSEARDGAHLQAAALLHASLCVRPERRPQIHPGERLTAPAPPSHSTTSEDVLLRRATTSLKMTSTRCSTRTWGEKQLMCSCSADLWVSPKQKRRTQTSGISLSVK